jgi:transcription elongation factor Elf1
MTNFRKVATGINAAELFQPTHYSRRVNCGNCGTYYMQITGVDEPEHLVRCKKCGGDFVWMVKDGYLLTIGMSGGEGNLQKSLNS